MAKRVVVFINSAHLLKVVSILVELPEKKSLLREPRGDTTFELRLCVARAVEVKVVVSLLERCMKNADQRLKQQRHVNKCVEGIRVWAT